MGLGVRIRAGVIEVSATQVQDENIAVQDERKVRGEKEVQEIQGMPALNQCENRRAQVREELILI